MASIEFAPGTVDDFERIIDYLAAIGTARPRGVIKKITNALHRLKRNPRLGRPVGVRRHELVIGRGATGYLVLYEYFPADELVLVLAVRSQREQDYRSPKPNP